MRWRWWWAWSKRMQEAVAEQREGRGVASLAVSCVPGHPVCAFQGQGFGLVRGRWTGGAAEGGAVGGCGVTGRVRVLRGGEQ